MITQPPIPPGRDCKPIIINNILHYIMGFKPPLGGSPAKRDGGFSPLGGSPAKRDGGFSPLGGTEVH